MIRQKNYKTLNAKVYMYLYIISKTILSLSLPIKKKILLIKIKKYRCLRMFRHKSLHIQIFPFGMFL